MKKSIVNMVRWMQLRERELSFYEQILVIFAITLATIRIIFPVWHDFDGTLFYSYPFAGGEVCARIPGRCNIDRSRTAIESGALLLLVGGIIIVKRARKEMLVSNSFGD